MEEGPCHPNPQENERQEGPQKLHAHQSPELPWEVYGAYSKQTSHLAP